MVVAAYLVFLYYSLRGVPVRDQMVPEYVIYITILLCAVGVVVTLVRYVVQPDFLSVLIPTEDRIDAEAEDEADDESTADLGGRFAFLPSKNAQRAVYFLSPVLYLALITVLGIFTSTFIFVFLHVLATRQSYLMSAVSAVFITILLYVVFIVMLGKRVILRPGIFL